MTRTRTLAVISLVLFFSFATAQAKDQWIQVKSKNFFLIGNASEKDIRKVATRLEQFRETFRLLFPSLKIVSPIGTNVIVFKSDSSYKAFKPKRADGKTDNFIAGYFQPGRDVNYITLSTEGDDAQTFGTIFHEYTHFIIETNFGKANIPPWINEGLAEYFETYVIENDQNVKLGLPNFNHIAYLQHSRLYPVADLIRVSNSQLLNMDDTSRSIFYAESWAIVHEFMQGGKGGPIGKYLNAISRGDGSGELFRSTFQLDFPQADSDLKKYVSKDSYNYVAYALKTKLVYDDELRITPLSEPVTNAYLGDLLMHTQREDEAEKFFTLTLKDEPNSVMANTGMGMVRLSQRKFDDARTYLESAMKADGTSAYALYQYATLLTREGRDELGLSKEFSKDTTAKIREALHRALVTDPSFTESYELLAYLDLANNENLDEAALAVRKAMEYEPGSQKFLLRLGEIYLHQEKFDDARTIADRISATAYEPEMLQRSADLLHDIQRHQDYNKQVAEYDTRRKSQGSSTTLGPATDPPMTSGQISSANAMANLRAINEHLRGSKDGETRVVGRIQKIDCRKRPIAYTVKTADGVVLLTSADFQAIDLNNFAAGGDSIQMACDANLSAFNAVITYKETSAGLVKRDLLAVEFVPADFRLLTDKELKGDRPHLVRSDQVDSDGYALEKTVVAPTNDADIAKVQRDMMLQGMKNALHKPAAGEKRAFGFLDKIECTGKGEFFDFHTDAGPIRLSAEKATPLSIVVFTPDLAGMQYGCSTKPVEYPVVFVYKDAPDTKAKTAGIVVSLDFMPKSFTLDE